MKRKIYKKPDIQVMKIQQRCHLLEASPFNENLQGEEVDEAW